MLRNAIFALVFTATVAPVAQAQEGGPQPYWVSISAEEARMRAGAGRQFPIEWVYTRPGLPMKVIRTYQGWRLVEDPDGEQGWIYASLLSERRMAMVIGEGEAQMRETGSASAALRWNLEPGVIGELGECAESWCELNVGGARGWVSQDRLWGAGEP